jgi:hypothetical protein
MVFENFSSNLGAKNGYLGMWLLLDDIFLYKNKRLNATTHDKVLEQDALAFVVTLDFLYKNILHQ